MPRSRPTLHMICGKIAAGKSTVAAELARLPSTILLSEDVWLKRLYLLEMKSVADYIHYSRRLRDALGPLVIDLLRGDFSVVLDFPANTVASRLWMRSLFESSEADHRLHFLDVPSDECRARLRRRNAIGGHQFAASDEEFDHITAFFAPPSSDEGFNIVRRG